VIIVYQGGELNFTHNAVAGDSHCAFVANGGITCFHEEASASSAILTVDTYTATVPGLLEFNDNSDGGSAYVHLVQDTRGEPLPIFSIYKHAPPGVTIGSLQGGGIVLLGAEDGPATGRSLTVGTNNLDTIFEGVIQDAGRGGSLVKVGRGTLILAGKNTYSGGTTVQGGQLLIREPDGAATGTGNVQVNRGVFGGKGIVSGAVSVGTGTGHGALLSPGTGAGILTIQGSLTLNSDASYKWRLLSNAQSATQAAANGITISGAQLSSQDLGNAALPAGTVFTLLNNTAATPILGTFSNLADSATLVLGSNTFQANYEGGDGNDLTLTVVP
jgi:autotransporter-associated beta strand protein